MTEGQIIAQEDYDKYKAGKMTKEELHAALEFCRIAAAFGDEHFQEVGTDYLYKMEELGIIKNLHVVD